MTQPVQEPTQGRKDQAQEFRTRQLFRRPASSALEWEADGSPVANREEGWGSLFNLPVLERHVMANNSNASGAVNYTIDNTYPHCGYIEQTSNNNWLQWLVQLGPKGSLWLPIPLLAMGPDFGKVTLQIGSAPYIDDALSLFGEGGIETTGLGTPVTFVDMQTFDCYVAVHDPYPYVNMLFVPFEITGDDGVAGTTITGTNPLNWNGGSGAHYLRLKTDGQNGSASGYKKRISAFILERVNNNGEL